MKDTLWKKITTLFVKPFLIRYLKKERRTQIDGFEVCIKPSVFHPKFFFSSLYLYDFVNRLPLQGKSFLEIGCGSGLISLLALRKQAQVLAVDINPVAVDCTRLNFVSNFGANHSASLLCGDLFDVVPEKTYDYVVINPPYFFEDVTNADQLAWNCGKNGEYFMKLFEALKKRRAQLGQIVMILADNCDLTRIENLAGNFELSLNLIEKKKIKWETNFIYSIVSN